MPIRNTLPQKKVLSFVFGNIEISYSRISYLTISNALQWRLQYSRIVNLTEEIKGISQIIKYADSENKI